MKSPFPGMDPYIEACGLWEDFHTKLVGDIERTLSTIIPERYSVRAGERSYVVLADEEGKQTHAFIPDVKLTSPQTSGSQGATTAVAEPALETEPVDMQAFVSEEFRETFVEVYDADAERQLVTSIEVLSPSNKRRSSEGWNLFLRKRQSLMLAGTGVVEIDLLRGGTRMPMVGAWPRSPYTLLVHRNVWPGHCKVWPAHFQFRLPAIPVPLLPPDPPVSLDLQPIIDTIYQRSRYHRAIDYSKPLQPALSESESAWFATQRKQQQDH